VAVVGASNVGATFASTQLLSGFAAEKHRTMTRPVGQSMTMLEAVLDLMSRAVLIGWLVGERSAK
jgi:hypothetical protein